MVGVEELKVGDKMYNVAQDGFEDFARYTFSEVIELTKTLAVLKNGVRLINQPKPSYIISDVGYSVYRNKGVHWHHVTLNAIRKAQVENEKIKVHDWFEQKKFTLKEKTFIYKTFMEFTKV